MNGFRLAIEDIKRLWQTNLGINALGLMIFPLIYCYIYLLAFWNPAGYLHKLPLAVVNIDTGIVQGNLNINIGNDLTNRLLSNEKMSWYLLPQDEAKQKLESGEFYLVLIIPPDFTAKAYSVGSANPESALLIYQINEGANALGANITRKVMDQVGAELRRELYTNYLKEIFNQILSGARGLKQAADAAKQLGAGTNQAYQGSEALTSGLQQSSEGMGRLADGLSKLQSGAGELASGAARMNEAIGTGVALAEQYINPIQAVLAVLSDFSKLAGDLQSSLTEAIARLRQSHDALTAALPGIAAAENQIESVRQSVVSDLSGGLRDQSSDLAAAVAALNALAAAHPELKKDEGFANALDAVNRAKSRQQQLEQDVKNLESSLAQMREAFRKANIDIAQAQPQAEQGIQGIISRLQNINFGEITNRLNSIKGKVAELPGKLNQLAEGAQKLQQGSEQLAAGLNTFAAGFSELRAGNAKLLEGSKQLQSGLAQIDKGQNELAFRLSEAANAAAQDDKTDARIEAMADPVKVKEENLHPVPANGVGFAPYFIALSLWTGSLVLFSTIDLKNVAVIPKRPISYMVNKYLALASVSVFQGAVLIFILGVGLGLSPVTYHSQLFTFAILWGLSCCAIHFFMIYVLGHNPGQFLSIVLLMLQLAASGGSYPTELEPAFFTFLHPFLPMSYAVSGFRNIISIGDQLTIAKDAGIIAAYGAASLLALYLLKYRRFLDELGEYE